MNYVGVTEEDCMSSVLSEIEFELPLPQPVAYGIVVAEHHGALPHAALAASLPMDH